MRVAIHQPQYLPWLGYLDKISRADIFVFLDDAQFKKNEWQNRNRIKTSQGWQWLTVPILHDFGQPINQVQINNNENWRIDHIKALEMNYRNAPYFNQYFDQFKKIYDQEWEKLSNLNCTIIESFLNILDIKTKIVLASAYNIATNQTQRLIDICKKVEADTYIAGEGCAAYMDFALFAENNIRVEVQKYQHPIYPQQWEKTEKFISHLSALDIIFNCGSEAKKIIINKTI
ncbi:MAG: WbqC family protein [Candidatus Omnitrophica bacterium]|nr:WbqC family protein [Candidatus Omnitrophota bacterium]